MALLSSVCRSQSPGTPLSPVLLRRPALSQTQIVFEYANHLWLVGRAGGTAVRLTNGNGVETDPVFSPDGSTIAFTGDYDGNKDVFTVPTTGGTPRRLTYHPKSDEVLGWSHRGQILFRSDRAAANWYMQVYTLSPAGGQPTLLPFPYAYSGSLSDDGKYFAYCPHGPAFGFFHDHFFSWGNYRGGLASTIWIARTDDLSRVQIPHELESDMNPVWFGNEVYFLSARHGKISLFSYNPVTKRVVERVHSSDGDIDSLSAGADAVVYSRLGKIYLYDPKAPGERQVQISVSGDMPEVQSRIVDVHDQIQNMAISPSGERAVFEARGDIFTVPSREGVTRDITRTPGVMERYPAWSPDGKSICYFSDATGLYDLYIADQTGVGTPKHIPLDREATYYFDPVWSPDSHKIAFRDNHLRLWIADTTTGQAIRIGGTNTFRELQRDYAWSSDSRWLAYTRVESNHLNRLYLYSLESTKSAPVSDPLIDARHPSFDSEGKYLFYMVSTNYGGIAAGTDMTSDLLSVNRGI
jgi:tricorn protease